MSSKVYTTESGEVVYGMVAEFETPADVYHAAEKVRDAGYAKWDVHTPFPIHGMEDAMGVKRTILPMVIGVIGLTCAGLGFLMQWWMNGIDYPLAVQGKPFATWQAFVPIMFELGILFSAFTAIIGMLFFNRLPQWYHPLLKKDRFLRTSDDRFVIAIEAADPNFDEHKVRSMLTSIGGHNIDVVEA